MIFISKLHWNLEIIFVLKLHGLEKLFASQRFFFNQKLQILVIIGHGYSPEGS